MSDAEPTGGAERAYGTSRVGGRLRVERERAGISLRELARRVGVSPSLVSQIELDRVNPSVSTLYALVRELGMTMSDVFGEARPEERVVRQLRGGDGLAERPETRRVINLASGVRWERLTPHSDGEFGSVLFATLYLEGVPHHAVFIEVRRNREGEQVPVSDPEGYFENLQAADPGADGPFREIEFPGIKGRYVALVTPFAQ